MKTTFTAAATVVIILVTVHSSPTNLVNPTEDAQNLPQFNTTSRNVIEEASDTKTNKTMVAKEAVVIDLEKINKMPVLEYLGRRVKSLWDYLIYGDKEEPQSSFVGRCIGIAKRLRQLIPIVLIGGGIIFTKLAFLVLFSLKTIGLVSLVLLLNVATVAAKLGAYLGKKSEHSPQNIHVHVQPWKSNEHIYSSSHLGGPPYGWDDKSDLDVETHNLYNLYEKLKYENNLRRYLASNRHNVLDKDSTLLNGPYLAYSQQVVLDGDYAHIEKHITHPKLSENASEMPPNTKLKVSGTEDRNTFLP